MSDGFRRLHCAAFGRKLQTTNSKSSDTRFIDLNRSSSSSSNNNISDVLRKQVSRLSQQQELLARMFCKPNVVYLYGYLID